MKQNIASNKAKTFKYRNIFLKICGAIFMLQICCAGGVETGVNLNGVYHYTAYQQDGSIIYTNQYKFDILVNDCNWVIKYNQTKASLDGEPLDIGSVASCDGTNIYVFHLQNPDTAKQVWGGRFESVKSQLPVALANIYAGAYPPPKEPVLQQLWLAFASPSCLLNNSSGKAKPLFVTDMAIFNNQDYKCGYHWNDKFVGSKKIRNLMLTCDGSYILRDSADGKLLRGKYPSPYDRGFTNGFGSWLDQTNLGGTAVPTEFEFSAFVPGFDKSGPSSPGLVKAFSYSCSVTQIGFMEMQKIPTSLPDGNILVSDRRFADRGYAFISYAISNKWLEANNPLVEQLTSSRHKYSLEDEALSEIGVKPNSSIQRTSPKAKIFKFIIITFAGMPVVFFAIKLVTARIKNKNKGIKT